MTARYRLGHENIPASTKIKYIAIFFSIKLEGILKRTLFVYDNESSTITNIVADFFPNCQPNFLESDQSTILDIGSPINA